MGLGGATARFADPKRVTAVRDAVRQVLGEYQAAYFALHSLSDKVEDLRILSLNAELAASRAGTRGAAIKVATQSTRELVNQLTAATGRMNGARSRCYRFGALAMRGLPRIGRFGRTAEMVKQAGGAYAESGLRALDHAIAARAADAAEELAGLIQGGRELEKLANGLEGLVIQAVAIANNMAIEATSITGHQTIFSAVAAEMQRHNETLKTMIEEAARHVLLGNRAAQTLASYLDLIGRQSR